MTSAILPYGATLIDLRHERWAHPLVLGFPHRDDYVDAPHYCGAVVGRCANRIANGRAWLGARELVLDRNAGAYHLHGGKTGLARTDWVVTQHGSDRIVLETESPDGHEGYPGNLSVRAVYDFPRSDTLRLSVQAVTDAATLVNFCHHAYFNLSPSGDATDHRVQIDAGRYLDVDEDLVPNGIVAQVEGTNLDFRRPRPLAARPDRVPDIFNHTLCLADDVRAEAVFAARVEADGGPTMEIWTNQPALHLYDGYKLADGLRGSHGRVFGPRSGLCLEAQGWTAAPNHTHFPSIALQPGDQYSYLVEYRFS